VRKRRRKARPEAPSRLDERLTALDHAALELQLLLETRAPTPEMPAGAGLEPPEARADELAHGRPFRPHDVPEAEVVIIRLERAAPGQHEERALAQASPVAPLPPLEPLSAPRPIFNGVVEEATVVIIRRPPRERIP
jgi:hypothetical protein